MKIFSRKTLSLAVAVLVVSASIAPVSAAIPSTALPDAKPSPLLQPAVFGDVPANGHRRTRQSKHEKSKPYVPLAKDPAAESEAARKAYQKRYGF